MEGLEVRRGLTQARVDHLKNESELINKEIIANADESSKKIDELYEEFKKASETYAKMKDQGKSLKSVL